MIDSGLVMLLRRSASGREVLVGLRSDGWYAGAISAILDKPDNSVKTVTGCRTAQIAAKQFAPQDSQSPDMTRHFILALCQEVTTRTRKQRRMSAGQRMTRTGMCTKSGPANLSPQCPSPTNRNWRNCSPYRRSTWAN